MELIVGYLWSQYAVSPPHKFWLNVATYDVEATKIQQYTGIQHTALGLKLVYFMCRYNLPTSWLAP
jgi:hypothetical protein